MSARCAGTALTAEERRVERYASNRQSGTPPPVSALLVREDTLKPAEVTRSVPIAIEAESAAPPAQAPQPDIVEVELQRGALTVKLRWPASATSELGTWMRELQR